MRKSNFPWILAFAALAALAMVIGVYQTSHALECNEVVWKMTNNAVHTGYGYPETKSARYWSYTFDNSPGLILRVSGEFPKARYTSYTLYNVDAGDYQGSNVIYDGKFQHLADEKIQPVEGSMNPYIDNADRDADNRSYEIWVIRGDSVLLDMPNINKLIIPTEVDTVSLFLRVYLPDNPAQNDFAIQGEVNLPSIETFNENGDTPECPVGQNLGDVVDPDAVIKTDRLDPAEILLSDDIIDTFRPGPAGLFPNGDAPYLVAPLVKPTILRPKIAVLRFKAPNFPDTRGGDPFNENDPYDPDQVRYWSICMGGWASTQSSECLADYEVPIDDDGYAHLLIGPDELISDDPDWINLKWAWPDTGLPIQRPILLFRQISPRESFDAETPSSFNATDFAFNANGVEDTMVSLADLYEENKQASFDIGEYAPTGVYCTKDEFIADKCGLDN